MGRLGVGVLGWGYWDGEADLRNTRMELRRTDMGILGWRVLGWAYRDGGYSGGST